MTRIYKQADWKQKLAKCLSASESRLTSVFIVNLNHVPQLQWPRKKSHRPLAVWQQRTTQHIITNSAVGRQGASRSRRLLVFSGDVTHTSVKPNVERLVSLFFHNKRRKNKCNAWTRHDLITHMSVCCWDVQSASRRCLDAKAKESSRSSVWLNFLIPTMQTFLSTLSNHMEGPRHFTSECGFQNTRTVRWGASYIFKIKF